MKKSIFTFLFSLFALLYSLNAQHTVTLSGITFSPNDLTINVGETVTWDNVGGFHNVNGSAQSYPGNPEGFSSGGAAAAPWMFSHTFTIPGTYDYHCDPHFGVGMTGKITVEGAPATGEVVITEIMYNDPTSGADAYEFIELYNNGTAAIEMEGWNITDAINFTFPQYTLDPGAYVILATNSVNFEAGFGVPAFQFMSGALSNGGETITLKNAAGDVIDEVTYGNGANGWPAEASGNGSSLVLCDVNGDNNNVNAWAAATTPTGFVVNSIEVLANPGAESECPFGAIIGFQNTGFNIIEDVGNASVNITLTNGNADPTEVTLELDMTSTATNGEDFMVTLPMVITFPGGEISSSQSVSISIVNDTDIESVETLRLRLTNPTNSGTINPSAETFTFTIIDDDTPFTNALTITGIFDTQVEPTQLWAKGIELQALDTIPDLSIFGIGAADNGSGSPGVETSFPAVSLSEGDCFYVANDSTLFFDFFGFYPNVTGNASGIDGNDAIELYENFIAIDVFGDVNDSGSGEPWEYTDGWAYRKSGTGPDGGIFEIANWSFSGINAFDNVLNNANAPVPFPICNYSPMAPTVPTAVNDITSTDINVAVNIDILGNDDLPNPISSLTITSGPNNGTATVNGLENIDYIPADDFCGEDVFTYEVCDANGCDEATVTINVICPTSYPAYDIATVTTLDANGDPDSIDVICQLQGIVHGVDFQGNDNIQFVLIDNTGGISVFSSNNFGYTVNEGDELIVQGTITDFFCLTQITPDTLWVESTGNALETPIVTAFLNESFESELIQLTNLNFVDPAEWLGNGSSFNVQVTNGSFTNTMRIDNDTELASMPIPSEPFHAIGLGGQFDNSGPCDGGYQFLPRYAADIIELDATVDPTLGEFISFYPNPVSGILTIDTELDLERITVSNLLGQVMFNDNQPSNALNVTDLQPGIYLLTFQVGESIWTSKLIKE